jgi:hypothetical protein
VKRFYDYVTVFLESPGTVLASRDSSRDSFLKFCP